MKTVFVFECQDGSNLFAYTFEESGKNLPVDPLCRLGWRFLKKIDISDDPYSLIGDNPKLILEAIFRQGYYISGRH
jgi:hypothetical protein